MGLGQPSFPVWERVAKSHAGTRKGLGERLIAELHCTACHEATGALAERFGRDAASDLSYSTQRLRSEFLLRHLAAPHDADTASRMPDLLVGKSDVERSQIASALVAFLTDIAPAEAVSVAPDQPSFDRGMELFFSVGCVACHRAPSSDEITGFRDLVPPSDGIALDAVSTKFHFSGLVDYLGDQRAGHATGSVPVIELIESEAVDVAYFLFGGKRSEERRASKIDITLVSDGRRHFETLSCWRCHGVGEKLKEPSNETAEAPELAMLSGVLGGCLSKEPLPGIPYFRLGPEQRQAILLALDRMGNFESETLANRIEQDLIRHRCYACHSRDGIGGPGNELNPFFRSNELDLGDEGRLPPSLTGVGRKLKRSAIKQIISGKMTSRPYMLTRMPAFHADLSVRLAEHFSDADVPSDELPSVRRSAENQVGRNMWGRALIGSKGLGCITCHRLGGSPSLGIQAMDLAHAPARLRPEWFRDYLLDPAKFRPGTRMPAFWPDGQPSLSGYGGSSSRQIDSLWAYLSELDQSRMPEGIENKEDFLLHPAARPLVFRTFLKGVGNHAIAVGFESGIHAAFDALNPRWAMAWSGGFLSAESTWDDRFTPLAEPKGEMPISIQLLEPEFGSPAIFEGYRLDSETGVPTFRYRIEGLVISDSLQPLAAGAKQFRRHLNMKREHSGDVWLDIASGAEVRSLTANSWLVDERLGVETKSKARVKSSQEGIHVQVLLAGEDPTDSLFIDYRW